jgi:hypothetical protein
LYEAAFLPAGSMKIALALHPTTPAPAVREIHARVETANDKRLILTFSLHADLDRLKIPPSASLRRSHELWRHTCFEVFAAAAGETGYGEFNFSPSLEWSAYRFVAYRRGMSHLKLERDPEIETRTRSDTLELQTAFALPGTGAPYELALCAVVEDKSGALSYWALAHPSKKPDFHHRGGFLLTVDPCAVHPLGYHCA